MFTGDYVFFTIEMLPEENVLSPEDVWSGNDGRDNIAREAFEAVFHVGIRDNVARKAFEAVFRVGRCE